jgi:hypothetical protein
MAFQYLIDQFNSLHVPISYLLVGIGGYLLGEWRCSE